MADLCAGFCQLVMFSGIGIDSDSGVSQIFTGIGIRTGIKKIKRYGIETKIRLDFSWNQNRSQEHHGCQPESKIKS